MKPLSKPVRSWNHYQARSTGAVFLVNAVAEPSGLAIACEQFLDQHVVDFTSCFDTD